MRAKDGSLVRRGLLALGLACLLFYAAVSIHAAIYQRQAKARLDRMVSAPAPVETARPIVRGELIGRVDVPRLRLSAAIAEGDDDVTLRTAVGHLPETALPWHGTGNVALAAHRDGLFRGLKNIRMDDEIRIVTPRGEYSYRVRATRVVDPDDVWVVAPTALPTVTLITCYPFSYIGNAPKRFVVQATMVSGLQGRALKGTVPN